MSFPTSFYCVLKSVSEDKGSQKLLPTVFYAVAAGAGLLTLAASPIRPATPATPQLPHMLGLLLNFFPIQAGLDFMEL